MKKFVLKVVSTALAIISLVAVLFTFTGCNQVVKTHTLMTVKKNQSFEIVLHGPGGTHDWNYTISSEDNIEFVEKIKLFGDRFDENGYELIGGNALAVVYRFKINKVGTYTIKFEYAHMFSPNASPVETSIYKIKVKEKI